MSSVESFVPSVLTITERAVEKVRDLKTEENNENIKLRVYVTCLLYTSPSPRDSDSSRMPSSA